MGHVHTPSPRTDVSEYLKVTPDGPVSFTVAVAISFRPVERTSTTFDGTPSSTNIRCQRMSRIPLRRTYCVGLLEPDIERLEIFGNTDELGHDPCTYLLRRLGVLPLEEEARHLDLRAEQRVRSRRGRLTYAS